MPSKRLIAAMLDELNYALWDIELGAHKIDFEPFFTELYRYSQQYNMARLARAVGAHRAMVWSLMRNARKGGVKMHFATVVRLLYYLGLRLKVEVDPMPRKMDFGGHKSAPLVDAKGGWPLTGGVSPSSGHGPRSANRKAAHARYLAERKRAAERPSREDLPAIPGDKRL